jgi:nucleotide-binding universal stress UspA family protein
MMYTRILVPIDGSDRALAALGPARRLAQLHGAQLCAMTVVPPDIAADPIDSVIEGARRVAGDERLECSVVHGADPASELLRVICDEPETLLCLSTRARGPIGRLLFGSVAGEVVRRADRPIVLVGPSCDVGDVEPIRRIVVCLDGTPEGEAILRWTAQWSVSTGLSMVLVRVVYPLVEPIARVPPTEAQLQELGYVRGVAERLEREGLRVTDVTVQHPWPPEALTDFAAERPGAVLAVSTKAAGPLMEVLEGSTAARVVRGSSVPVLVARHG